MILESALQIILIFRMRRNVVSFVVSLFQKGLGRFKKYQIKNADKSTF